MADIEELALIGYVAEFAIEGVERLNGAASLVLAAHVVMMCRGRCRRDDQDGTGSCCRPHEKYPIC